MFETTNPLGVKTPATIISPCQTKNIERLCFRFGKLIPVFADSLAKVPKPERMFFCLQQGIYSLPTVELIDFLEELIPDKEKAIEIGAGNGVYGRSLGIRSTDNFMQHPKNRAKFRNCIVAYEKMNQPLVQYGDDVEELDAKEAVRTSKAETVIGAWVTHKYQTSKPHNGGNMFGVDFRWILNRAHVKRLILIGNEFTHANNPIMELEHRTYDLPFLFSRSAHEGLDRVYVWDVK